MARGEKVQVFKSEDEAKAAKAEVPSDGKTKLSLYVCRQEGKEPVYLYVANSTKAREVAAREFGVSAELVDPARKPKEPMATQLAKMSSEEQMTIARILAELGVKLPGTEPPAPVAFPADPLGEPAPVEPVPVHKKRGNK